MEDDGGSGYGDPAAIGVGGGPNPPAGQKPRGGDGAWLDPNMPSQKGPSPREARVSAARATASALGRAGLKPKPGQNQRTVAQAANPAAPRAADGGGTRLPPVSPRHQEGDD